ncbi:MAG: hypothetical protein JWM26_3856 [Betaproteobacteria bacterium]|nr:hypothetical protein [Betaproteobacteria bacterium]
MADKPVLLKAAQVQALHEEVRPHPLDARRVRHTRSLGDAVGFTAIGIHLVRLEKDATSSVRHFHHQDEEWVYILSGRGVAEIGDEKHGIEAGDFLGFVAGSPAHCLRNAGAEDLVFLVGGDRPPFDVCDYPQIGKRRYRINGRSVFVDADLLAQAGEKLG